MDTVNVPAAEDMEEDNFLKHMDFRHIKETGHPLSGWPGVLNRDSWILPYRAFHERLHDLAVPGQHDHEHLF